MKTLEEEALQRLVRRLMVIKGRREVSPLSIVAKKYVEVLLKKSGIVL